MRKLLIALIFFGTASSAFGQTMTTGDITMVRTGWNLDAFAIVTRQPISNPARCAEPDGYLSMRPFPGYSTYYVAALVAFVTNQKIVITVHNSECAGTRPKLIGINMVR